MPTESRSEPVRVDVRKTCKLFINGAFPRSESGRTYVVADSRGRFLANAALGSRKDARDAVLAARAAQPRWWGATAYNRGQVLYRVAEILEGRREQFIDEVSRGEGITRARAAAQVAESIDRWVYYAGFADKVSQVLGSANAVAGPYFNLSVPEPNGVMALIAPERPSLLGLVAITAPALATGNACVIVASQAHPLPAIGLSEVLATSDVPGGVVNILTGSASEIGPWLAGHRDVDALDLTGVADAALATDLVQRAAGSVTRVRLADPAEDLTRVPGLGRLRFTCQVKTVWHPIGT